MATQQQITEVKVLLNNEQAKSQLADLQKKYDDVKQKRDNALSAGDTKSWKKYQKELETVDKQLTKQLTSMKNVNRALDNLSTAKPKELQQTIREINRMLNSGDITRGSEQWRSLQAAMAAAKNELQVIRNEVKEAEEIAPVKKFNQWGFALNNIIGSGAGLTVIIDKLRDTVSQATTLATEAEGIELAFSRINKPDLLDNLRRATRGTVSDLELMKAAVQFRDFNLDVEQLGNFLAFAQQKAKDTGQSIDFLVNSIVTGLGRQSKPILDNLGISATEITTEMAAGADMVTAVSAIIERNMKAVGQTVETAADRAARATARQQNALIELGRKMLPLKEQAGSLYASFQIGTIEAIQFIYNHRAAVTTLVAAYAVYQATIHAAAIKEAALNAIQKTGNLIQGTRTVIVDGARLAYARLTGNLDMATAAQARLNAVQKANVFLAIASAVVALYVAVEELVNRSNRLTESQQAMADAMKETKRQMVDERAENERLAATIADTTRSQKERNEAIERFNDKLADNHLNLLTEEEKRTGNLRDRVDELNQATTDRLYLMALEQKYTELMKKRADIEVDGVDTSWNQDLWDWINRTAGVRVTDRKQNALDQIDRQLEDLHAHITQKQAELEKKRRASEGVVIVGNAPKKDDGKKDKNSKDPYETDLKRLEDNQKTANNILKLQLQERRITEEQYQRQLYESDMRFLALRLQLQQKYGKDVTETQQAIATRTAQEAQRQLENEQRDAKQRFDQWYGQAQARKKTEDAARKKKEADEKQLADRMKQTEQNVTQQIQQNKRDEVKAEQDAAQQRQQVQQALYQEIGATLQSASQLFQALQQAEVDQVERRYDSQIEAARKSGRDTTALEKKREAEVNAIKRRYANREFQMKVLSIAADTAVAISRQFKDLPFYAALGTSVLVAAQGAMQLAVAKQQRQQAMQSGYYEGGFTGGRHYRREAGVVHEGEFVANHMAVQNRDILPALQLIDRAQRNNTVARITADDVARSVGRDGAAPTVVSAPTVNVTTDNTELHDVLDDLRRQLSQGISSYAVIDGPDGLAAQLRRYDRLLANK